MPFYVFIEGQGQGCQTGRNLLSRRNRGHHHPTIGCNTKLVRLRGASTWAEAEEKAFEEYERLYRGPMGAQKMTIFKTTDSREPDLKAFQVKAEDNLKQEKARQLAEEEKRRRGEGPTLARQELWMLCHEDEGILQHEGVTYTRTHMGRWEMHDSFGEDFRQKVYFKDHLGNKFVLQRRCAGVPQGYDDLDNHDGRTTRVGKGG